MFRTFSLTIAFCALTFTTAQSVNADIIYTAEDFAVTQPVTHPGWSFDGGTFTTNGFLGSITTANVGTVFTEWDLTFTSAIGTYNLTELNSTISYTDGPATNLFATATELVWPNTANPGPGNDTLRFDNGPQDIRYRASDGPGGSTDMRLTDGDIDDNFFLGDRANSTANTGIGTPVTIASVPEPSSFLFLSLVGSVGVGIRWSRNRRMQV